MTPAELAQKGLRVKPLVWEDRGHAVHPQLKAQTAFDTYYVNRSKSGLWDWWSTTLRGKIEVRTIEAAKAAAEADHAARIAAMIEETPHDQT